ncbi:MAG: TAT-variant-translocated molybdopterin oxidoreductase [Planctomycetota bacterium]|jgi:molybdopterin-containing oxidoreductase family iron-sulfur binding subunit
MSNTGSTSYWKSLKQRSDGDIPRPPSDREFAEIPEPQRVALPRRDFLAAAGFALGGVALGGCSRAPVEKAIPYLVAPESIVPGHATFYASTCGACNAGCGLIVKNRDGRAIKLEGNPDHPISRGGLCAVGQASILGLYDSRRLRNPLKEGQPATWDEVDNEIMRRLTELRIDGAMVRVLTGPIVSPTKRRVVRNFLSGFADAKHVSYEVLSSSAIRSAHLKTHGRSLLPRYSFEKAEVIVGLDADFLGTWISPVAFTAGWAANRNADDKTAAFSYHAQVESRLSVTGAKADRRVAIAPSQLGAVVNYLASRLANKAGGSFNASNPGATGVDAAVLDDIADRLWHARGKSLVACGSQDVDTQVVCNFINHMLGNYGKTLDPSQADDQDDTPDGAIHELKRELAAGNVDALFVDDVNPVYDLPDGAAFADAMRKAGLLISFADRTNDVSALAHFVCPNHHYLESWGDVSLGAGQVGFQQPVMKPLLNTRSTVESLSKWAGNAQSGQDLVRRTWGNRIAWDKSIHDGFTSASHSSGSAASFRSDTVSPVPIGESVPDDKFALVLYPKVSMLDGRGATNPWLQEMPDPITKVVWDNYASISESSANRLGVETGDVLRVTLSEPSANAQSIELPALVQVGQHDQVVAIALGYGHPESRRFADVGPEWLEKKPTLGDNGLVGTDASSLLTYGAGTLRLSGAQVSLARTDRKHSLASTQDYHNIEVPAALAVAGMNLRRPMVQETTLSAFRRDGKLPAHGHAAHHDDLGDLWPDDHKFEGHHWGMAIDLTACTGCSACVVSCQIENNVPVVGRDEVRRKRIMHWLRIDRYFSNQHDDIDVLHQPVMCQHCDHAPCETVFPVLATGHSEEGLNQQTYNRCVGTRYCANNCPFKVRRFNWFDYAHDDAFVNMVLNPDITVRSRGVMEKCSFCVQRIEESRIHAKKEGRPIGDGEIKTACQQSCPASAIVFGDMNDPQSRVSKLIASGRHYRMLEETNVKPSVGYLGLVRNREDSEDENHHG